MYEEQVLAVLNFYLAHGQTLSPSKMHFIEAVASLAGMNLNQLLMRKSLFIAERLSNMGFLAAGVAHEINNPLTYVQTSLEEILTTMESAIALKNGICKEEDLRQLFETVLELGREAQTGVQRIKTIVSDIKTFSSNREERSKLIAVSKVMDSAVSMASYQIKHKARLKTHYGDAPMVRGAEGKLAQVFLNLLVNAAHAFDDGPIENNTIDITISQNQSHVIVEIKDSGCGIPRDVLPHVFQPFYTTKPSGVGTGLGLSISDTIIRAMGGTIAVQSEEGKGTTFTITLPAKTDASSTGTGEIVQVAAKPEALKTTVLLVDDDHLILKTLARRLISHHTVVVAESGEAAVAKLEARADIEVVVTDLMMEGMSGVDLFQWIKENRPELLRRVIFATGGSLSSATASFLNRPDVIYLEKPFRINTLLDTIQHVLRNHPPL
ncbi:response regulator [Myxococcota bacterium]|nr:response regulator [Myxococcota bacterium]